MEPPADLFLVEPEEFVAARDALARQLKSRGDAAAVAAVKALRRPTLPVWLLNLVAHDEPDVVEQVRRVGAELRAAQSIALKTGEGAGIREMAAMRRRVVDEVVRAALRLGGERGREVAAAHRDAISATVEAALADDALAAQWASARLRDVHDATGFNFGDLVTPAPARTARSSPMRTARSSPTRTPRTIAPEKQPEAMQDRQDAANERAARLREEADAARCAVDAARNEWAEADRAAKAAKQRMREAERAASRADLFAATAEQAAWEAGERARR
ncbi:MAG TPA: hypothetical protein VNA14_08705 [Mycobacteriales bacterium]|nr:hypothetical protein [Mycobacteriales bacterium]